MATGGTALLEPATSIDGVVERMQAIDAALPHEDGVAYFNRMYLQVTLAVRAHVKQGTFECGDLMSKLDVVFANLYFTAYSDWERSGKCEEAWRPLFKARGDKHRLPIQFAFAGMNAHINHDLPLSVVRAFHDAGLALDDGTPEYRDYDRVNKILAQVEPQIKGWFETGLIAKIDKRLGKVDDALAMWSISDARKDAWKHAQVIWRLRHDPHLLHAYEDMLGGLVGLAGRGILI